MNWDKRVIFLGVVALCLAILWQCKGEAGAPISPVSPPPVVAGTPGTVGTIGGVE